MNGYIPDTVLQATRRWLHEWFHQETGLDASDNSSEFERFCDRIHVADDGSLVVDA